jgi:hypothetical protein
VILGSWSRLEAIVQEAADSRDRGEIVIESMAMIADGVSGTPVTTARDEISQ